MAKYRVRSNLLVLSKMGYASHHTYINQPATFLIERFSVRLELTENFLIETASIIVFKDILFPSSKLYENLFPALIFPFLLFSSTPIIRSFSLASDVLERDSLWSRVISSTSLICDRLNDPVFNIFRLWARRILENNGSTPLLLACYQEFTLLKSQIGRLTTEIRGSWAIKSMISCKALHWYSRLYSLIYCFCTSSTRLYWAWRGPRSYRSRPSECNTVL